MIEDKIRQVASLIDPLLKNSLSGSDNLHKAALYLPSQGGKRMRAFLVVKSCELVGGDVKLALPAAAAIEVLHNFTLIHDDIMDHDLLRRGVPTVHTLWGVPMGILAGDFLFAKAFNILLSTNVEPDRIRCAAQIMSESAVSLSEGQSMDMEFESKLDVSEEDYLLMVTKKTASLFEASAEIGAIIGGGDPNLISLLGEYGRNLGVGFQIFDDYLGLTSKEEILGKSIGNDIREGKKTLIIIRSINSPLRERTLSLLGKRYASDEEIAELVNALRREGIDDYVLKKAKLHIDLAIRALSILPDSPAKQDLVELARYAISRIK
ncbi:MAG: polyprenyl synthetase family protein [Candidatus Methanomethyliaceae archaeon]|nr:polyprenyl synthetase family protein [Candidatus Methanomethyliaceae archaeon]